MKRRRLPRKWLIDVCAACVCCGLMCWVVAPVYWSSRLAAERVRCRRNLSNLGWSVLMYAQDSDDTLPDKRDWMDCAAPYVLDTTIYRIRCPAVASQDRSQLGYAMNSALSGKGKASVKEPANTPMLFDSVLLGWNAASGLESLPKPGRHGAMNTIAYVDGHVKAVNDSHN